MRVVNLTTWVNGPLLPTVQENGKTSQPASPAGNRTLDTQVLGNKVHAKCGGYSDQDKKISPDNTQKKSPKPNLVQIRDVVWTMKKRKRQRSPDFPVHVESMCLCYSIQL